jgi:hypothetical protein
MTNSEYAAMIEAARQEGRAEGERLGVAGERAAVAADLLILHGAESSYSVAQKLSWQRLRIERGDHHPEHSDALTRLIAEAFAEGRREGFARGRAAFTGEGDEEIPARGHAGAALDRLIAEKQAEALEAWAGKIREAYEKARVDDRFGDYYRDLVSGAIKGVEEQTRERAAAYRKGGAP